jgi:hypothetical protein
LKYVALAGTLSLSSIAQAIMSLTVLCRASMPKVYKSQFSLDDPIRNASWRCQAIRFVVPESDDDVGYFFEAGLICHHRTSAAPLRVDVTGVTAVEKLAPRRLRHPKWFMISKGERDPSSVFHATERNRFVI